MLPERNFQGPEAERIETVKIKGATPPGDQPPAKVLAEPNPNPKHLYQFNLRHPTLPGTISVTVVSDAANARGLAYLVAEEFCQQVIGQIRAG